MFIIIVITLIIYRYRQCQQQGGFSDCGLFAIGFAAVLASGAHPSAYRFDQAKMRPHLESCLSSGVWSMFPIRRLGRESSRIRYSQELLVYCNCRMPDCFSEEMVQCKKCREWYHIAVCVSVKKIQEKWYCRRCNSNN